MGISRGMRNEIPGDGGDLVSRAAHLLHLDAAYGNQDRPLDVFPKAGPGGHSNREKSPRAVHWGTRVLGYRYRRGIHLLVTRVGDSLDGYHWPDAVILAVETWLLEVYSLVVKVGYVIPNLQLHDG